MTNIITLKRKQSAFEDLGELAKYLHDLSFKMEHASFCIDSHYPNSENAKELLGAAQMVTNWAKEIKKDATQNIT